MLVVDASVIIKTFVAEQGSQAAVQIVGGADIVVVPAHAFAEVTEALVRKWHLKAITRAQLDLAAVRLPESYSTLALHRLVGRGMDISIETGASVYDCLYVAAAIAMNCQLVTADRRLITKMVATPYAPLLIALDSFTGSP